MTGDFAIAAGHLLTAEAGAEVLRAGGTAVDAAIAAGLTAMVAEPVLAGFLGGGFMMVRTADGHEQLLDFFVQTPKFKRPVSDLDFRAIEADFGETVQEFHIGSGAIAVSGLAPGLVEAHRHFGRIPLSELTGPAARAARAGIEVTAFQAGLGRIIAPILKASAGARALLCHDGEPLGEGALYRNPEFAEVLEVFGVEGANFVQRGEIATVLLSLTEEVGHLTEADLRAYRPEWRAPLIRQRGVARIALNPPPSLGGTLIAFALEMILPGTRLVDIAGAFEATTRARVEAGLDRVADDALACLLAPELVERYREHLKGAAMSTRGTTQISVFDGTGLGVALTLSNGEGCGLIVPGTGIMANNMLGESDLVPGGWHSWEPDRRLASMMCPLVASWPDGRAALMGSGGSNRIRTALTQVLIRLIDSAALLVEAVEAPRLHVEAGTPSAVDFELEGLGEHEREDLCSAFPQAQGWPERSMFYGGVHAVARTATGAVTAAGDPRRAGVAISRGHGAAG